MSNVYYDPEKLGLKIVGVLDQPDLSYEYNTFVVWQHEDSKRLFYATDTGCSCPTPFEEYNFESPDNNTLTEIKAGDSWNSFVNDVSNFCNEDWRSIENRNIPQSEKDDLISKVKALLK